MGLLKTIRILHMFGPMIGRLPITHLWFLFRQFKNEVPHVFNGQIRINSFFPPFPSAAFSRFCRHVIRRSRVPYTIYMAVTGKCLCSCDHCSYGHRRETELPTEQWLDIIDQLRRLGACTLGFSGGEPLMREDIVQLVEAAGDTSKIIFTTGQGLDDRLAKQLADAGTTCITVGMESDDPEKHDAVRHRKGSYNEAIAAIEACRRAGIYTAISTTAFAEKIQDGTLERMCRFAADRGIGEFRVLSPVATGTAAGNTEISLSIEMLERLKEFHRSHNRKRAWPVIESFALFESADLFGCGAGYHHLFIDSAGEICPCDLTPLSFGNATTEPLESIWNRLGEYFFLPRCACVMRDLLDRIGPEDNLPLPREVSEKLCGKRQPGDPLPGCYKRLFKNQ